MKFAIGAAIVATIALAPAHAAQDSLVVEGAPAPIALVRTADLDLRDATAVERLHARVKRAATRICYDGSRVTVADELAGRPCRDQAIASAGPQIDRAISMRIAGLAAAASSPIAVTLR